GVPIDMPDGSPTEGVPPTRARLLVLGLITAATLINYLDRTVISVAAPLLSKDLGLSPALMGVAFSAFSWTYAAAQIPGGILLDRLGVRLTYYFSVTLWSICTLLQGLSIGLGTLVSARLALGIAEAPAYPCNSRILNTWFPQHERARATGVYSVGQYFGLAFLSPVLFWIAGAFGWRVLFVVVGLLGVGFGLVWLALYRDPEGRPTTAVRLDWKVMRQLIRKRQILGASLGQFASNSTLVFFLTWFPTYLATERHMAWLKVGFFAILPFIAATVGVIVGGVLSDYLLRRTGSANIARKLPIVSGLALASTIVAANFLEQDSAVIAVMSVAFFGQGMCNLGWTLISDVAPKDFIGLTAGIFNLCANLAGIVTPLLVGAIVQATGSFAWALAYIAALAVGGTLSYLLVVGDVRRVEI
ncbi:MAG TPA: MFS transporter, partial [Steroidobacteraceae bacterium]